jgi:hypothetical protein
MSLEGIYVYLNFTIRVELCLKSKVDKNVLISKGMVLLVILSLAENSSGSLKLILGATKESLIISREYTISLAPAIHISWPVIDLVEVTKGFCFPKIWSMALASFWSPMGVEVACALM